LLPRLAELPAIGGRENVGVFAWFGLQGGSMQWDGFKVYPGGKHAYGLDMIGHYAKDFRADVVITLIDIWTQGGVGEKVAPAAWWPWFPIDGEPVAKIVSQVLDQEPKCRPLVFSHWGREVMSDAGYASEYLPIGIEPKTFRIMPEEDVLRFRQSVFGDCDHLTVMVAANKGSDMLAAAPFQAEGNFFEKNPVQTPCIGCILRTGSNTGWVIRRSIWRCCTMRLTCIWAPRSLRGSGFL